MMYAKESKMIAKLALLFEKNNKCLVIDGKEYNLEFTGHYLLSVTNKRKIYHIIVDHKKIKGKKVYFFALQNMTNVKRFVEFTLSYNKIILL